MVLSDLWIYAATEPVSLGELFRFKKGAEHKQVLYLILSIKHHHGVIRVESLPVPRASLSITHFFVKKKNQGTYKSCVKLDISTEINVLLFKTG